MNSVTRHQAAVMLGVTDQTISNYCKEGLLGHYKGKGNILYINLDELNKYKSQLKVVAASEKLLEMKKMGLVEAIAKVDKADMELRGILLAHKPKNDSLAKMIGNLFRVGFVPKMSARECDMVQEFIQGTDSRQLAEMYDLSVPRVQQIIEKGIRRFDNFAEVSENLDTHYSLQKKIENLQLENEMLKGKIAQLEKREEFNPSEYLSTLLNSRLVDYNLSARALTILAKFRDDGIWGNPVKMETIGDLTMRSGGRKGILSQRNCGKKTFYELDDLLESLNLDFKMPGEEDVDYYKRMRKRFGDANE